MPINEQTLESFLSGNLSVLDEIVGTDASVPIISSSIDRFPPKKDSSVCSFIGI